MINIDRETSIDFMVDDIRELKLVPLAVKPPKETEGEAPSKEAVAEDPGSEEAEVPAGTQA